MKNKAQAQIITVVLIILLVLAAIVIVWQVIKSTVEEATEFQGTIHKKACESETLNFQPQDKLIIDPNNKTYEIEIAIFSSCYNSSSCGTRSELYLTSCEQIKVDEIEIKELWNPEIHSNFSLVVDGKNYVKYIRKKKQELSTDWLEENCECCVGYEPKECEVLMKDVEGCQKYKCEFEEDYIVEVE